MGSTFATIFPHGFTSLFIVKGERFYELFLGISPWRSSPGKYLNFHVTAPSPSPAPFFTVILTGTTQLVDCDLNKVKLQKDFSFTYFFQILGSNIRFLKILKSTLTIDFFFEFSCKSRFAKVDFAIPSFLWKPNLTFCFWDQAAVFFGN